MKLINPTDDELNAAFSENVAGIKCLPASSSHTDCVVIPKTGAIIKKAQQFTHNADAVLPWLEKWQTWSVRNLVLWGEEKSCDLTMMKEDKSYASAQASTFPRAAVIALLRAHGVEIEFTQ